MKEGEHSIFDNYDVAVRRLVCEDDAEKQAQGLSKSRAIELSEQQLEGKITRASMEKLYKSLACDGWKIKDGKNWVWHDEAGKPAKQNLSKEVLLERAIAALDMKKWTYQMSTASGVQIVQRDTRRVNLNSRRAIDLVRYIKPGHYAFVELKVGSNNPLYAAFEILGYALAYLHARANDWTGTEKRDVFGAEKIELTVLGPGKWYTYGKRGSDKKFKYKLDWLADEIAKSLNDFVAAELKGMPTFTMKFRDFPDIELKSESDFVQLATEIHHRAECEWWKN